MAFEIEDHIRVRAYHLWEANGRPEGRDLEFWEQARQTLSQNEAGTTNRRDATRSKASTSAAAAVPKRVRRSARSRPGRGG
jgi:hypothetical protein